MYVRKHLMQVCFLIVIDIQQQNKIFMELYPQR